MTESETLALLNDIVRIARAAGATEAEALLSRSVSLSVRRRMRKPEALQRSEETEVGLRLFVDKKSAIVSSSDCAPDTLKEMAMRAVAMAKCVPDDPFSGIADVSQLTQQRPDLDLFDATDVPVETLIAYADTAEESALTVSGVTNSEGAECSFGKDHFFYVASNGFAGTYASSGFSLGLSVVAGEGTGMEVEDDFTAATFFQDLESPETVGRSAGMRAVAALDPRKVKTQQVPVVFDRRLSGGLIGSLAAAISGSAVARGTTLLKDCMSTQVFARGITIIDDPFLKRGHRSRPFDAEGLAPQRRALIDGGILTGWVLDLASARKLDLASTGNATRGVSSPPAPRVSNFYMQPGALSPEQLIGEIDRGLLITSLMGDGGNILTGDYSRGAKGFWIEKGQIAYPVAELTIAGNLKDMWMNATPANDLEFRYGIDAPTLRIDGMTVAGT